MLFLWYYLKEKIGTDVGQINLVLLSSRIWYILDDPLKRLAEQSKYRKQFFGLISKRSVTDIIIICHTFQFELS